MTYQDKLKNLSVKELRSILKRISTKFALRPEEKALIEEPKTEIPSNYDSLDTWRDTVYGTYKGCGEVEGPDPTVEACLAWEKEQEYKQLKNDLIKVITKYHDSTKINEEPEQSL